MKVVVVECDEDGNIDVEDLKKKAEAHASKLARSGDSPDARRVRGVDPDVCAIVHKYGGQVYMDGANLNAQVGLVRPAEIGADVCHINLHKTFCIRTAAAGRGWADLRSEAPRAVPAGHAVITTGGESAIGAVSAAPWSSSMILPISWMYIAMMGPDGLQRATEVAILNANYVAKRLSEHYPILYTGKNGLVAHECIVDVRPLKKSGIEVEDVAKRLMDYGFHADDVVPGRGDLDDRADGRVEASSTSSRRDDPDSRGSPRDRAREIDKLDNPLRTRRTRWRW
jgi:glycine dehydrogenase